MDEEIERVFLALEQEEISREMNEKIRLAVEAFRSKLQEDLSAMIAGRANRVETGQYRRSLLIAVTESGIAYNQAKKSFGDGKPMPVPLRGNFVGSHSVS